MDDSSIARLRPAAAGLRETGRRRGGNDPKKIDERLQFGIADDSPVQPGAGEGPVAVGGGRGNAEAVGGLVNRQARKVTQFDQLRLFGVLAGEFGYGLVQRQQ